MEIVASSCGRRRLAPLVGLDAGFRPTDSEEDSKSKPMFSVDAAWLELAAFFASMNYCDMVPGLGGSGPTRDIV